VPSQVHTLALPRVPWTLIPFPIGLLYYIVLITLHRTHTISEPAPVPNSLLIMRILADHAHAIKALAATSTNSLNPATLCVSYEGAVNLAHALNTSENLTDRFTALATKIEDLSLDRDATVANCNMLSTCVTQLESKLSQTLALANLASSSIPTPCKTQPDPKPFTGEERDKL
jgi:hypothetical protein